MANAAMRFALLDCEDAAKWAGHEVIAEALLHPGASWQHYRCFNRELPPLDSVAQLDGVLISGSHHSVYDEHQWIRELEEWLRQAVPAHPQVRFLAICFGAQVMAQALGGGRVGKNPDGGFVLKVESVQLSDTLRGSTAMRLAAADAAAAGGSSDGGSSSNGSGPASVRIIQSHGDQVLQLPPSCVLLAHSPTAPVEMFSNPAGNLLAVQGHVELSREETLEKIWPAITASGRLTPEESEESRRSLAEDPLDAPLMVCLFRRFMERGLPEAAAAAAAKGGTSGRSSSTALEVDS